MKSKRFSVSLTEEIWEGLNCIPENIRSVVVRNVLRTAVATMKDKSMRHVLFDGSEVLRLTVAVEREEPEKKEIRATKVPEPFPSLAEWEDA